MAMSISGLTEAIKSGNQGKDNPSDALSSFWKAVCDYVESNAEVVYAWAAATTSTPPTPDPMTSWTGTIKTSGNLSLCNLNTPDTALAAVSSQMNAAAALWVVEPPAGFSLSPMVIIPTINLTKSGATDRDTALKSIATDIINGIKAATPASSGSHGSYVGVATFTIIN